MTQPIEVEILKENEYKLVELVCTEARQHVVKTFRGHSLENCERNARHTFDSLVLLKEHFSDVLRSPNAIELDGCSVTMEFLETLPGARQMDLDSLPSAAPFFRRCYEIEVDPSVIWSIEDSVHVTPRILELMQSDFPTGLGFKGDLYENLRLTERGLMLADSETASAEPRGLSELILYIYLTANTLSPRGLSLRPPRCVRPTAFSVLDRPQREALLDAALEFCNQNMSSSPAFLRSLKLQRSRNVLVRML